MITRDIFLLKLLVALFLIFSQGGISYAIDMHTSVEEKGLENINKLGFANSGITPQPNILLEEFSEAGKIVLMSMIASVCYGIIHDAITINICFDYFRSDMTHHGPQTRRYFPFVYQSNSKILYTLLWGTIATFWVGAIAGIMWSISARSNQESLTWRDLITPTAIFMSCTLACAIIAGILEYRDSHDSFKTAEEMHKWSYAAGALGAVAMAFYFFYKKSHQDFIKIESNGLSLNLASLFFAD